MRAAGGGRLARRSAGVLCALLHTIGLTGGILLSSLLALFLPAALVLALADGLAHGAAAWIGVAMPLPALTAEALATWLALGVLVLLCLVGLGELLWPRRLQLKGLAGADIERLGALEVHDYVASLCRQHRVRPPRLWVAETPYLRAFVLSPPFRRAQLVVSRGVLSLPAPMVRWILAHEVAHLVYRDAERAHGWQRYLTGLAMANRLRTRLFRVLAWCAGGLPVVRHLLVRLLVLLDRLFARSLWLGIRVGTLWYEGWARWASRRMEFRADAFAARQEGAEAGIALFEGLADGDFEPRPWRAMWRTHPAPAERIRALRRSAV